MGTNESWLAVALPSGLSVAKLEASVVASYETRGAKLVDRAQHTSLERMAELGRGAKLGVAIMQGASKKWACIVDSQVGTSDAALAKYVTAKHRTTVFRYADIDAAHFHGVERLGPSTPASTGGARRRANGSPPSRSRSPTARGRRS